MDKKRHIIASGSRILMLLIVMIMGISMVSAFDFFPTYDYNDQTKTATIYADFLKIQKVADIELISNTDLCLSSCEAVIRITPNTDIETNDQEYKIIIKDLTKKVDRSDQVSSITFEKRAGTENYNSYEKIGENCQNVSHSANGTSYTTRECSAVYGNVERTREKWDQFQLTPAFFKKIDGSVDVKIKGVKDPYASVDWIPKFYGVEISEWATWTSSFNTDLLAYWDMNTTSGVERVTGIMNLSIAGTGNNANTGKIGNSWSVSAGSGNRVDYASPPTNYLNWTRYGKKTVNFWIREDSNCGGSCNTYHITTGSLQSNTFNYLDDLSGGWRQWQFQDNAVLTAGSSQLTVGTWYMITSVWNGTDVLGYVDGAYIGKGGTGSYKEDYEGIGTLLGNQGGTAESIDEVGLWNRTLSASEIADLYNGGSGLTYIPSASSSGSIAVNLSSYPNGQNFTTNPLTLSYNSTAVFTAGNFTNATLYLWNSTGVYATNFSSIASYPNVTGKNLSYSITRDNNYIWNVQYCGLNASSGTICSFATTNQTFLLDSTPPVITFVRPLNQTYQNPSMDIVNVSVSDATTNSSTCFYSLNGATNVTMTRSGDYYMNTTNFTGIAGSNNIRVSCNDSLNNWGSNITYFSGDTSKPTFVLNSLNNVSTVSLPVNVTLDVTTSDTNLQTCWYKTSDNSTNTTYTCNTAQNILFQTGGDKTITVYANDTFNNQNSTIYSVRIYDFNVTQSGSATAGEGSEQTFTLLVNSTSFAIGNADASLWYDGANKGVTTKTAMGTGSYYFTTTFTIPTGTGNSTGKGISWYWNYNATQLTTRNTSTQTQTVYNVSVSDCAITTGRVILNMTLKDEELVSLVNVTAPNTANIEVDLYITSLVNASQTWQFSKKWSNNNSVAVCIPNGLLNSTTYMVDFVVGYDTSSHVREFFYMDNGTLDNTNYFNSYTDNTIDLLDLATADSTTFLFEYTDQDNQEVEDIIVHTFRKYIGEGVFREVERSKQDNAGQTHVHLVEEDVIYYFMITQYGNILFTSDTYNAKCLSTPCEISLSASATAQNWSVIDNEGGQYSVSVNKATRIVTTTFSLDSIDLVNATVYRFYNGNISYVNGSSLTATSGSIDIYVPLAYDNSTFFVAIYNNNVFVKSVWVSLTESARDYFGTFGAILGGLIVVAMMLMAVSEGAGFIIFTVLALIIVSIMQLVDLGWMALISIICAGGIIIWKLVNRRGSRQ